MAETFTDAELGLTQKTFTDADLGIDAQSRLDEAANFFTSQPLPTEESLDVVGLFAARELSDLTLGIPDLLATTAANLPSPTNLLNNPFDPNFAQNQTTLLEDVTGQEPPEIGDRVLPVPRTDEIVAGISTAQQAATDISQGEVPQVSNTFDRALQLQQDEVSRLEQSFPGASTTGKAIGTGLALFTGRAPFVRAGQRSAAREGAQAGAGLRDPSSLGRDVPSLSKRVRQSASKVFNSGPVKTLKRGAGRSAETGLEATVIGILNGADTQEQKALAAGGALGQAIGSGVLQVSKEAFQIRRLPWTVAGLWATHRVFDEFLPGEEDVFRSVDFAFDKIQLGIVSGAIVASLGAGRGRNLVKNVPEFGELVTAVPRGSLIGAIVDSLEDSATAKTLERMTASPEKFKPRHKRAIDKAIKDNTLKQTVNRLRKQDKEFSRALDGTQ